MSTKPEVNRYLSLSGDRIGTPYWKNLFLSYSFMCAVTGATFANLLSSNDKHSKDDMLLGTIFGVGISLASIRAQKMMLYNRLAYSVMSGLFSPQLSNLGHTGTIGAAFSASAITTYFNNASLETINDTNLLALTILTPFLSEGICMSHRAIMVGRGKWRIIDKDDVKQEETEKETRAEKPSVVLEPT